MHIAIIAALSIYTSAVTSEDYDENTTCGNGEVPAGKAPLTDAFCNQELTHTSKLNQLRHCVCDAGYVRNAWGHCITMEQCEMCKVIPNHDFHICETACPVTCGEPIPTTCTLQCVSTCACPPGYVRVRQQDKTCVPVSQCPPICPLNSSFELCKHGCAPKCRILAPGAGCKPSCHSGQCVCRDGYAMDIRDGAEICVLWEKCSVYSWNLQRGGV